MNIPIGKPENHGNKKAAIKKNFDPFNSFLNELPKRLRYVFFGQKRHQHGLDEGVSPPKVVKGVQRSVIKYNIFILLYMFMK